MALSSNIVPANGYAIVQENTTAPYQVQSNATIGTVLKIDFNNGYANIGDIVLYMEKDSFKFSEDGVTWYNVVPLRAVILFSISEPAS